MEAPKKEKPPGGMPGGWLTFRGAVDKPAHC